MIDPVIFSIGPISVRWYSLAYITGIVLGWMLLVFLNKRQKLFDVKKIEDDCFLYSVLGIVLGGRLGYVLFYDLPYFINNPLDILKIYNGGMSFHGGFIGLIIAIYLLAKKYKIDFVKLLDMIAICGPIGLFLGRIANFINQELYGRITDSPIGIIFDGQTLPRHPSQLYEAFFEGLFLFCLMLYLALKTKILDNKGKMCGVFLFGYGMARFFIEFFREPDVQVGYILSHFTMGQFLCLPMLLTGGYLLLNKDKNL